MAKSARSSNRSGNGDQPGYRFIDDIMAMAGSLANSRKGYAADKLDALAGSVREFSEALPDMPTFKSYATAAADSFEGLASYVTDSDLETMVDDARQFARRHPMAMLAGSVAAGVIVAQMVNSRSAGGGRGRTAAARNSSSTRRGPTVQRRKQRNA